MPSGCCDFLQVAFPSLLQIAAAWVQVIQHIMQKLLYDIVCYFQLHSGY